MSTGNGESEAPQAPLELGDTLTIQTHDGATLPFEVVGVLEDRDGGTSYAVLLHEPENPDDCQFIVTDLAGTLLDDQDLAEEILDDFFVFAETAEEDRNGSAQ